MCTFIYLGSCYNANVDLIGLEWGLRFLEVFSDFVIIIQGPPLSSRAYYFFVLISLHVGSDLCFGVLMLGRKVIKLINSN
jgi:hypothetical protein